jgi:hypothetical protein
VSFIRRKGGSRDGSTLWAIQKRCGAEGGVGAASLETCSPRRRHMEEIEATQIALDSRLVNGYRLRRLSLSCLAKIAQFWKESEGTLDNDSVSSSTEPS